MTYRYVPILRWKRGERVGLEHTASRTDVVPILIVGPGHFREKKKTTHHAAVPAPAHLADEILQAWGAIPFHLDATGLPPTSATHHPISDIATSARHAGLSLIPLVRGTSLAQPYTDVVKSIVAKDKRGVGLLIDLAEMAAAAHWVAAWPFPPHETDLVIDLENTVGVVHSMGAAIVPVFRSLHGGTTWRTVTLCGTSIPDNFSGYAAGLHTIDRAELDLWQTLTSAGLPYRLNFGDYATVPLNPPPPGIKWGYPINVKYTLDTEFLVCRGVSTTGLGGVEMDVQLVGHARHIVGYPTRNRITCWADDRIDQIAASGSGAGNLEHWVQIGVNRHLELTRQNLP